MSRGNVCTRVTSEQFRETEFIILLLFILFCSCNYQDKVFTQKKYGGTKCTGSAYKYSTLVDVQTKI